MNKHKVKAFTIMEVTVAMLIASIAIGITYTIYTIVAKSYSVYNVRSNNTAVLIRLDELLKNDFEHADRILKTQNGITLKGPGKLVNYEIESDFIVRTAGITDTFKVKTQEINTSFENAPLTEINSDEEQNRIDELQMMVLFEDKKIPYHYFKQYSSTNLMQRNTNAVN
ncbi:type II secretion system protein J [Mucilaginibacter sp. UR6-11]|uniref:PulJ/GspJ family protein n=1 Tax=Mucilaginibacter sp. UR6-11 TaxID=1435644 RepID=UPI001E5D9A2B|nr:hypothetical protein [Mucilaginibacter sp. UR6-11]MCC8427244.1 hypothetical protein [Mucilaginibacter sp. UR6-11]